jgi:hypothetical protein
LKLFDPAHLRTVGETYWQHLQWAWGSALVFALLVPLALLHGLMPWLLSGWPDRVLVKYIERFRARRQRTGQAQQFPEKTP